jgi:hypothetical protein
MLCTRIKMVPNLDIDTVSTNLVSLDHPNPLVFLLLSFDNRYLTCHPHHQPHLLLRLLARDLPVKFAEGRDIKLWTVLIA